VFDVDLYIHYIFSQLNFLFHFILNEKDRPRADAVEPEEIEYSYQDDLFKAAPVLRE